MEKQGDAGFIPRQKYEKAAFLFLFLGVPFAFVWDCLVVTPTYYDKTTWVVVAHYASELYIIINILGNFYMAIKLEILRHVQTIFTTQIIPLQKCNACSLKRDHHCIYLGTCVSYFNLRYFIVAVVYIWIGAVYGLIYYLPFYINTTDFSCYTFLQLIAPHVAIFFGYMTSYTLLLSVFLILILAILIFSTFILYEQTTAIIKGQTQWERKHDVKTYNIGFYKNMKQALGEKWYLVWLFPTVVSPLLCDGISFAQT
uniref:Palmitoyltransferase n=1 Tax=Strigamia maritima TaxID=126957 RepID=T1JI59_STRMM